MIFNRLHPAVLAILGIGILSGMDVLLKMLGSRYPTFQLTFLRFFFGFLAAELVWLAVRPPLPSREAVKTNVLRGSIVAVSATLFFYGLQTLPLAEAVSFSFLSPLFLAFFGALILKEVVGRNTVIGLIIGFMGMLVMVLGQGAMGTTLHLPGALAAICSAITYALSLVLLRQRAQQDALVSIVVFQNAVPAAIMALPAFWVWVPIAPGDHLLFVILAAMGVAGHLLMGAAFRRAEASKLAVTEYSALVYATLLGFLFFNEMPGLATFAGTGLIVIGTLIAMRKRRNLNEPPIDPAP
ncbi:MAG: DMT family transporter [Proteobacteria bacterium]|nr:DMT family transporter [Pseudomonadota bacterium]